MYRMLKKGQIIINPLTQRPIRVGSRTWKTLVRNKVLSGKYKDDRQIYEFETEELRDKKGMFKTQKRLNKSAPRGKTVVRGTGEFKNKLVLRNKKMKRIVRQVYEGLKKNDYDEKTTEQLMTLINNDRLLDYIETEMDKIDPIHKKTPEEPEKEESDQEPEQEETDQEPEETDQEPEKEESDQEQEQEQEELDQEEPDQEPEELDQESEEEYVEGMSESEEDVISYEEQETISDEESETDYDTEMDDTDLDQMADTDMDNTDMDDIDDMDNTDMDDIDDMDDLDDTDDMDDLEETDDMNDDF